jgi:O-antigen/teichoic acid export membrane protein
MTVSTHHNTEDPDFSARVKSAVLWRSGTQIVSQLVTWGSTLTVIRILDPHDYGIFAMTQVVMVFMSFLSGYGFASSLVQAKQITPHMIRQTFGLLVLLNAGIAAIQFAIAPLAAQYYRQEIVLDMLHVQALIFLSSPFIILGEALLARNLEFRKTAMVNLASAVIAASSALACALAGLGVWTLVIAPLAAFWTRAIGLFFAARLFYWPSFDFRGASGTFNFGLALLASHMFWTIQSQSDIFIAGRVLDPHDLGIYAEALFLTTIFAAKFVPPLNEVAFPAYARLQSEPGALAYSFLKAVRLIMLISCPLYLGMSVTAEPLVATLFGPKWLEMAPFVSVLALAMPVMTLQILFAPANNALGRPHITARISMFGAIIMPLVFLTAIQWGVMGLVVGWLVAFPLLTGYTFYRTHAHIGITVRELLASVWPGLSASIAMAALVYLVKTGLVDGLGLKVYVQLALLVACGGGAYIAMLWVLSPATVKEVYALLVRRQLAET